MPSARDSSPPRMAQKHPAKSPESGDSAAGRAAPPAVGPAGVPLPAPHPAARPGHVLRRRSLHAAPQLLTPVSPAACTPGGQAASVLRVASRPPWSLRCLNPARGARDKERGPRNPRNELLGTGVAGNGSAGHRRGRQRTLHRRRAWPRRKPSIRAEDAVGVLQPPGPAPRAVPLSCSPPRQSQLCGYLLHDQLTESSLRLALLLRGRDVFSIHRSKSKGGRE